MIHQTIGVDPGPTQSAFVVWDGATIIEKGILPNEELRAWLKWQRGRALARIERTLVCEYPGHVYPLYTKAGKPFFPQQLIDTAEEVGLLRAAWGDDRQWATLDRSRVKLHLIGRLHGGDPQVNRALQQQVGPKGTKAKPGPTYGVHSHIWAALGVAVTYHFHQHRGNRFGH